MTKAGNTHDIEISLPDGSSSGFMLTRDDEGRTAWRRFTTSLTPSSAPPGPASTQTFPPEIRQEIKLRTGHAGIGLLRHVESSGFVGESNGVDTRFEDAFIPGPKPIYTDEYDIKGGEGSVEGTWQTSPARPTGWTPISSATLTEETTIVYDGNKAMRVSSGGGGQYVSWNIDHTLFLQCRVTMKGRVYVETGNSDAVVSVSVTGATAPSNVTVTERDEWVEVEMSVDVDTTALSNLDLNITPATGDDCIVDGWTNYIDYFVGPPGGFAYLQISDFDELFMASARTMWKINRTTGAMEYQDLAPAVIKDVELHYDRLYTAVGSVQNFEHSTDGSTWAANALNGDDRYADGFAVTTNWLGRQVLWKWLLPNKLASSTTPLVAGSWMHWEIGDSDTDILDVLPMPDGTLLITKSDGVYPLGPDGIPYNVTPSWRVGRWDKQGAGAAEWLTRGYIPAGRSAIWEFDLQTRTQRQVNASTIGSGPELYSGRASKLIGDGSWLYAFQLKPGSGDVLSELLAGRRRPDGGWRWGHLAELDAGQVDHAWISNTVGTGPRLYFASRDIESEAASQQSVSLPPLLFANTDNSSGREWVNASNAGSSDDARATWPDESVLATISATSPGTQAVTDYADGEVWSGEANAAASDDAYATSLLDSQEGSAASPSANNSASGWTTPGNAYASDDASASVTVNLSSSTYLQLTGFGLSIPTDATITHVRVLRESRHAAGVIIVDTALVIGGSQQTLQYEQYESSSIDHVTNSGARAVALWADAGTLTPAQVNASNFGVAIQASTIASVSRTLLIDHVSVQVTYRRARTDGLRVTNFGFSLPAGAKIGGVTASIERKASASSRARDYLVQLVVGGSLTGDDKASATDYTTSDVAATYGSALDLWGLSLTKAQVEASAFGIELRAQSDGDEGDVTVSVDHITLEISYTEDETSDYLEVTAFGFGTVPTSAQIDGVEVSIKRRGPLIAGGAGTVRDATVQLLVAGSPTGDNKADTASDWPETDTVKSYGGAADGWSASLTPAQLKTNDFGVRIAVTGAQGIETAEIDSVTMTVYYNPQGGLELNNRLGYITLSKTENPRFCDCYVFSSDVTFRTGVINRFPGWKSGWQEVIVKTASKSGEALGSGGRQVKVRYNLQDGAGWLPVGGTGNNVVTTSPLGRLFFKSDTIDEAVSEDIELEIELEGDSGVVVLEELSLVGTVRPPAVEVFQFTVAVSDNIQGRSGRTTELKASQLAVLRGLNNPDWAATLTDRDGTGHQCYVLTDGGIDEQDVLDYRDAPGKPKVITAVSLTLFKIPNSDDWAS